MGLAVWSTPKALGAAPQMELSREEATYRIRRFYAGDGKPEGYERTYEIQDDTNQLIVATADVIGDPVFKPVLIRDLKDDQWEMRANRRIMPSKWTLSGPSRSGNVVFNQKIVGKLINPFYKTVLTIEDECGDELYSLVDVRKNTLDTMLNLSIGEYALLKDSEPIAKFISLNRDVDTGSGLMGKLKRFFAGSDDGFVSLGGRHVLEAPVVLCMFLLFQSFTDSSVG